MPLDELEFELSAEQYAAMGYPGLRQGQPLALLLDGGLLLPEAGALTWYAVQKEPLPPRLVRTGPAQYAFCGQIRAAELLKDGDMQRGVLLVDCGIAPVRVTCLAQEDGTLPWGTWETRYISGHLLLEGLAEDSFAAGIGEMVGVTAWHFRRLMLTPGDPHFGDFHETDSLLPQPYVYDRLFVTARLHRARVSG
jgi:hypothetical protein